METKLERIQETSETFFRDLYSQPSAPGEVCIDAFLSSLNLPSLSDFRNENLIKPITKEEINAAITKSKLGKAVGLGGYSSQWYRSFRTELVPLLLNTFNYTLQKGVIPPSWRETTIPVIPKEGTDRRECRNYRPIRVLNSRL